MILSVSVKLVATEEQRASLLQTMEQFNAACDYIAGVAFVNKTANKVALQKLVYYKVRERFGLSSQMAIRAIAKVVEAYKRDKRIQPSFHLHGAMVYDQRIFSRKGADSVSLLTLGGRIIVPFRSGMTQAVLFNRFWGHPTIRKC